MIILSSFFLKIFLINNSNYSRRAEKCEENEFGDFFKMFPFIRLEEDDYRKN